MSTNAHEISPSADGRSRTFFNWLRERSESLRHPRSDTRFAFAVSLIWLVAYNSRFWSDTAQAMWHGSTRSGSFVSVAFLVSLFVVVLCLQALLLLLVPTRRLMLGAAAALFLVAAISSYFIARYGVVMNKDMLRNVFETDRSETGALLTTELVLRTLVLGVIPALIVLKVKLPAMRWSKRLRQRGLAIAGTLAVCALALVSVSSSYAVFFREHKPIRFALSPAAPVTSAVSLALAERKQAAGPLINASGPAQRTVAAQAKPLVLVVVVGETARAANFELGGYARHTNPALAQLAAAGQGLVYFQNATSCGTATAMSVPCMFSHLPRSKFDVDAAPRYANLLDALQSVGFDVEWRDNNAGCKGVCARVRQISYPPSSDARFCGESDCYDEVMLQDLPRRLAALDRDTVIVMHQMGSHGPAYASRYPAWLESFKPACHSNQLQHCSHEEVVNAYDNTIAYTDRVLGLAIEQLRGASKHVDSMLIYASDHGESLGEQGLYLHGLPYAFAPDVQKHVPMLMWMSDGFLTREHLALPCVEARAALPMSHDNIYHTVLGAAETRNSSYDASLDILSSCRNMRVSSTHE
jgi:lipid A ethanolaminephosphotransferase